MKARLLYKNKIVGEHGTTEMVVWQLPHQTHDRPHGIKYSLYHGDKTGRCLVRYDNETGKGDHKHIGRTETTYTFTSVEQLIKDFISDVIRLTQSGETHE